jgi:hypothetical protein
MGRGLGALMTERKPQGDSQNPAAKTEIAAGVRTLMQGHTPAPQKTAAPQKPFAPQKPVPPQKQPGSTPRGYLLAADALLIGVALLIAFTSPKPMPTARMIFAITVVMIAAVCGLAALFVGGEKE